MAFGGVTGCVGSALDQPDGESLCTWGSAKVEYVADRLDGSMPLGHRALIFSQFRRSWRVFGHVLERRGVSVVQLDKLDPQPGGGYRALPFG